MTQLVTIQQAARNALKLWLDDELAAVDDLVIEPRWFEQRDLPPKAISIIDAGKRETDWTQLEIVKLTDVVSVGAPQVDATWKLGYIVQRVQLDLWALSDVELDDIIARLDKALNRGSAPLGITNLEPVSHGLVVPMLDGWDPGTAHFLFGEVDASPTPGAVRQGEWRGTYRGEMHAMLAITARSPRMARILMKQRLRQSDAVDETASFDVTTITADGETHSTDP